MPVPFAHGDVTPFSGHCLLTAVEVQVVLPAVPGLVLVGEAAAKRSRPLVLDFGLDVFCHSADSWRERQWILAEVLRAWTRGCQPTQAQWRPDREEWAGCEQANTPFLSTYRQR